MTLKPPNLTQLYTVSAAVLLGWFFVALGMPLPFLFGALGSCLVLAVAKVPLQGFPLLSTVSRTVLGVAIGTSFSWELFAGIGSLLPTLLLVPVYVVLIALFGGLYFHHMMGYDRTTAYYSAMPGALQDMVAFGQEAGANARTLALVHATRLLLMVSLAPIILIHIYEVSLDNPLGPPSASLPIYHNALIVLIGIVGWQVARHFKLFGASVIGPILIAIPLSLLGFISERPSQEAVTISQFFIGLGVGINYHGITGKEIRRDIVATSGFVVLLLVLATLFISITAWVSDVPDVQRFLSFWPSGQAEIAILSLAAGANVGVVVAHHLVRLVFIILGAPLLSRFWQKLAQNTGD